MPAIPSDIASLSQSRASSARDRLLLAGADLLERASGGDVSTRAICDLAGVQAPTLYHHFDSKQGLLDAVVSHGFRQFLKVRRPLAAPRDDPIADIRDGWDSHVMFGLEHPSFYAYVYGNVQPGKPCGVVADVEAMILEALMPAAREGRLRLSPEVAAKEILAASTGVILTLITQPAADVNLELSSRVRDAILDSVTGEPTTEIGPAGRRSVATAAITLAAALDEPSTTTLTQTELALLRDWLHRLSV